MNCPECGNDLDGGSILETFVQQREDGTKMWQGMSDDEIESYMKKCYSPPYRWGREIAIYSWEEDRTIQWKCPDCEQTWGRS